MRSAAASTAALVATVIGGTVTGAPGAIAVSSAGNTSASVPASAAATPSVWPRPQSLHAQGGFTPVTETVTLVAGPQADPYALEAIRTALREAGARHIVEAAASTSKGTTVYADGPAAAATLRALGAAGTGDLPAGGYRLAVGGETVALAGAGDDGLFHAAQTLRQLVTAKGLPGVVIRDWPATAVRGTAESFYGEPWSQSQRLAQLDFLGRTKQNQYLYAPGDDPYRQEQWREPYPAAQRSRFRALAERAERNHVTLAWAVAPGQAMCFSSEDDRKALLRKIDAMWALGMRAFQLQFQDVSYSEWQCGEDADTYGSGPKAAAHAQADVANAVAEHLRLHRRLHFTARSSGLSMLPTEYYQDGATAYRTALAGALNAGVPVAWTGVGVVPEKITGTQVAGALAALGHPLLTLDNYPVNDYAEDRLFLGPYNGREPAVALATSGVLAAAMRQAAASRIPLFTAADYAWNPGAYDPAGSWQAAIDDLAGKDAGKRAALRALAGNDASSALGGTESAYLRPLLKDFWTAYDDGTASGLDAAAGRLKAAFATMQSAPESLDGLADGAFGAEVRPWLSQLARYGDAGGRAVDMLLAQQRGDGTAAWRDRLAVERARKRIARSTATVGAGVLAPFLAKALETADAWSGVGTDGRQPTSTLGSARSTQLAAMTDGKDSPAWTSDAPPQKDDAFGVDLGTARTVRAVRVTMGAQDRLRDAVLEYSAGDGSGWRRAGEFHDESTVTASLPAGAKARYVRLRSAAAQESAVSVREFAVTTPDEADDRPADTSPATDGDVTTAYRPQGGSLTVSLGSARPLDAVTVLTDPAGAGSEPGSVEVHVPGEGWRSLGALGSGWTELPAHAAKADALRLTWNTAADAPPVHEIVPWYADRPAARMTLDRTEADVEVGGDPATVSAELADASPDAARVTLTAAAPDGVTAAAPGAVDLPRGGTLTVPVTVAVPEGSAPGTYEVPVTLTVDGRAVRQTVTVHAYPRTGGSDLARGAQAVSSADESADFPASSVTDGDAATRWSSPAQDGAWVQVQLERPAAIGRVDLVWQDAYASRYEVLTSADGVTWHTAATVADGAPGARTVHLDAPADTRFLRVQGIDRGTKYGYSLYSVAAYTVASG
ncbi:beta-N-acetylglucosaminidase domain-containing protein [Streptomyces sp. NBC_01537]|uniref:beta-N-acetylglucosaminidase domain-containing protein n=1 Tax=Streptomyces sp. NBC_01537 TaxID=2903896 RepID=UPI00386CDE8E